jgi:hypothetical protein
VHKSRVFGWLRGIAALMTGAIATGPAAAQEDRVWSGPAQAEWDRADEVILHGTFDDGVFVPKSLSLAEPAARPAPRLLSLTGNVLPSLHPRVFGVEERVELVEQPDGLRLNCRKGTRPAGVVLETAEYRFPLNMAADLAITGEANEAMGLSLISAGGDAPEPAQTMLRTGRASLPLRQDTSALVVTCPAGAGEISLHKVRFVPHPGGTWRRGTWVWEPAAAIRNPSRFAGDLAAAGIDDIAIQVPANPADIVPAARILAAAGVTVHLVEGDPEMIKPEVLIRTVDRVRALRQAVEMAVPSGPALRLELDIEPYGGRDYPLDPISSWQNWAMAIRTIAQAWGDTVDVDVPWWMRGVPGGATALAAVRPWVGTIVVMAYRTEPDLILDAAEPWLALGRPVKIAIESGKLEAEGQQFYRRAAAGTLVLSSNRATLLKRPALRIDGAETFSFVRETRVPADRITFYGRDVARRSAERILAPLLAAWPNFAGFRIHGLRLAEDAAIGDRLQRAVTPPCVATGRCLPSRASVNAPSR